jgi:hypothetical protein
VEAPKNGDAITSEKELLKRLASTIRGGFRADGFAVVSGTFLPRKGNLVIILGGGESFWKYF